MFYPTIGGVLVKKCSINIIPRGPLDLDKIMALTTWVRSAASSHYQWPQPGEPPLFWSPHLSPSFLPNLVLRFTDKIDAVLSIFTG